MSRIAAKHFNDYPWYVRLVLRRQHRKYGRMLAPSLLWGRLPRAFVAVLASLGAFQGRRYPVDAVLRSLVSIRIAQLNGCHFCVDLNAHNFLQAAGEAQKPGEVARWRDSSVFTERERAALDYAEAMTIACDRIAGQDIDALKGHFSEDEITALSAWIAFQNMSAKFNAALGAEEHGFCRPAAATGSRPAHSLAGIRALED
ncbi:MAG: carboxymuconolactone decarboxylase family protein [Spirochaetes bacterium]|jgi:AhpD family alkylhydroperoxidase|nr:carboxymuconolactone decarboxylase family protein [Spirochaetota bacterium]